MVACPFVATDNEFLLLLVLIVLEDLDENVLEFAGVNVNIGDVVHLDSSHNLKRSPEKSHRFLRAVCCLQKST